MTRYVTYHISK